MVSLSSVFHIRAPCLNRSKDIDVNWHDVGSNVTKTPYRPIVSDCRVADPSGRGDLGSNPQPRYAIAEEK